MKIFAGLLVVFGLLGCNSLTDEGQTPTTTSIMIVAAALPEPNCGVGTGNERLKRGIFDIKGVDAENTIGAQYQTNLVIRDQTQTGVGSKKLMVEYDFSANLIQPTAATRNLLRQERSIRWLDSRR
jgi:hypothetical protein